MLFGIIPPQIDNLPKLQYLDPSGNQLSRIIPPKIGHLNQLRILYFDVNHLRASIPPEIGHLNLSMKLVTQMQIFFKSKRNESAWLEIQFDSFINFICTI